MKVLSLYAWNYIKKLLHFIGRINTFVILSIFYFAAFFPGKSRKNSRQLYFKKTESEFLLDKTHRANRSGYGKISILNEFSDIYSGNILFLP